MHSQTHTSTPHSVQAICWVHKNNCWSVPFWVVDHNIDIWGLSIDIRDFLRYQRTKNVKEAAVPRNTLIKPTTYICVYIQAYKTRPGHEWLPSSLPFSYLLVTTPYICGTLTINLTDCRAQHHNIHITSN